MSINKISFVILAGGEGRRLSEVVHDRPKVMGEIGGKPFLSYILYWLKSKGVKDIFISVGFMKNKIIDYYQSGGAFGLRIKYLKEGIPLGTGGAVINALKYVKSEIILFLNGDTFLNLDLDSFLSDHDKKMPSMTIACIKTEKSNRYGSVVFNKNNQITSFVEKENVNSGWINGGIYLVNKSLFNSQSIQIPISLEKEIIPNLLKKHKINAFTQSGIDFIDIGTPNSFENAESFMKKYRAI